MDFQTKYLFYFIFLWCFTGCIAQDKNIGDSCDLPVRGKGVCKKLSDCPKVRELKRVGYTPNFCRRKPERVVCCEGTPTSSATSPPQVLTKIAPATSPPQVLTKTAPVFNSFTPVVSSRNLRKCQQKCLEYSAPVQTTINTAPLSIDSEIIPTHISNCVFELKPLIYGGALAEYGEFPHMALLGNGMPRIWYCGGSLISEQFVLTAAHCFQKRIGRLTVARLGELNTQKTELNSEPEDVGIADIIIHPQYTGSQVYNDIALVKLVKRVTFSTYVRPACLWNQFAFTEDKAIAAGWGTTEQAKMSENLLKVTLNIIEHETCKNLYKNYTSGRLRDIRRNIVCASNNQGGDTCQGDSGGPLEITDPHNQCIHYIIGVTSAGRGCGSAVPGIYTRVSHYVDWIEGIVWP